jgi:hypothetical protein
MQFSLDCGRKKRKTNAFRDLISKYILAENILVFLGDRFPSPFLLVHVLVMGY